ncbi:hypothetical protein THASP1DRAFT_12646 [Thamnocephalis sphaerospora]|uniref:Dbl homology domain-containing protein n=1 Tax=Thamnocephalis sphaerospora TaxID=78915 RepID=A0A4P9XW74_9FUNG|nr:hypothetical protein THASP1DRAFT_12646 [Thamnocephalis sphaerospora]|eukprot:RKP10575.1 hypothetical protein THASP1DRAFT_12646 [Thamnocephalis sphaerospora]
MSAPTSFFQTSIQIIDRLSCLPGFEHYLDPDYLSSVAGAEVPSMDPVTTLWNIFRIGNALCELVNIARPQNPLAINRENNLSNLNGCKKSVFHFRVACNTDFGIRQEDIFSITELYQQDTNGFVRVLKTVSLVLDSLEQKGLVDTSNPRPHRFSESGAGGAPQDNRAKVVRELLETERSYIRDLEMLQNYHQAVQRSSALSPDDMLYLFANLNELADFQRKFLIGVEENALQPPDEQHFGLLFLQMEEKFSVYEPFCANYERAANIVEEQASVLMRFSHIMEPQRQLLAYLIKPIQRICKYPLLIQEMIKSSSKDMPNYVELTEGLAAIKRAADRVNETRRKVENQLLVKDLEKRVKGWHEYSAGDFGELLLHDKFVMSSNDIEKELMVYLFENIMICCKEVQSKKNKKKAATLQLKGRIFISSITGAAPYSRNGVHALKVLWRDAQMGNFSLRCRNDEQLRMWHTTLERLIASFAQPEARQSAEKKVDDDAMSFMATSDDEEDELEDERDSEAASASRNATRRAGTYSMGAPAPANRGAYPAYRQNGHQSMPAPARHQRPAPEYAQHTVPSMPGANSDQSDQELSPGEHVASNGLPRRQTSPNIYAGRSEPGDRPSMPHANSATVGRYSHNAPRPVHANKSSDLIDQVKIKVNYMDDVYVIFVARTVSYRDLLAKLEKKIRICGGDTPNGPDSLKVQYFDEDGDRVTIKNDEDVQTSFECRDPSSPTSVLNFFVC